MLLHSSVEGPHCWDDCWLAAVPADYGHAKVYSRRPPIKKRTLRRDARRLTDHQASGEVSARRSFFDHFPLGQMVSFFRLLPHFATVCCDSASFPPSSISAPCGHPLAALSPPPVYSRVCSVAHPALSADDRQWWWWWGRGGLGG